MSSAVRTPAKTAKKTKTPPAAAKKRRAKAPLPLSVVGAPDFRKANQSIGLQVYQGSLSLQARRIYNVMIYHAQREIQPGRNAPIEMETASSLFWLPMSDVVRMLAYGSNDLDSLKETVQSLQAVRVVMQDDRRWASEMLLSSVQIVNNAGLGNKAGKLWIGFAFPPEIAHLIIKPREFTRLSIIYQSMLSSTAALALYEICRRYVTNPTKLTHKAAWEWWHRTMSGAPIDANVPEYKYFKRDLIKPAIQEINAVTDIDIELIEHKEGSRRVQFLQFKVEPKAQQQLGMSPAEDALVQSETVARMVALGLSQESARALLDKHDRAFIEATLAYTEQRLKDDTKSGPIDSPAAFFRAALRDRYASPVEVAQAGVALKAQEPPLEGGPAVSEAAAAPGTSIDEMYIQDRRRRAEAILGEMDESDWVTVEEEFLAQAHQTQRMLHRRSGVKNPAVRDALLDWYANKVLGPASDEDFLIFARTVKIGGSAGSARAGAALGRRAARKA